MRGQLFLDTLEQKLRIGSNSSGPVRIDQAVVENLVAEIEDKGIHVLVLDPFISAHTVTENDNVAIDAVVKSLAEIAVRTNCAIELVHHTRKLHGDNVDLKSARGGSSFSAACREVRLLKPMGKDEAAQMNVTDPADFFSAMTGKRNYARSDTAAYYRLLSVALSNRDDVGVAAAYTPPAPCTLSTAERKTFLAELASRQSWWHEQSSGWAGEIVAGGLNLDIGAGVSKSNRTQVQENGRRQVRRILALLKQEGFISIAKRQDQKGRAREYVECASP